MDSIEPLPISKAIKRLDTESITVFTKPIKETTPPTTV